MKVNQEVYIYQWDSATGDVFTSVDHDRDMSGLERAVITHIGDHSRDGLPLCWVEWVDRPMVHQANGSFRPSSQLFLEVLR
jgi:hypothetical protein